MAATGTQTVLTDEGLPLASSASVASKLGVGLKTDLTPERGLDLTLVSGGSGEERTAELGLDEKLGVEQTRGRVEGSAWDGRVENVDRPNGMSRQEPDDLEVLEANSEHTGKDFINSV